MQADTLNKRLQEIERTYRLADFPQSVLVEVTAFCNINCVQCANSTLKRKKGFMDMGLFRKIVDEVAERDKQTRFWFAFYGEPLIIRYKLFYMIQYAKRKGLTDTYVNTNGMLLSDEMAEMLIDSGLDHLIVGVDGYSAEVFEKIRRGAKRDVVYSNILRIRDKMAAHQVIKPRIELQFIMMDENESELEDYRQYWAKEGLAVKIRNRVTWNSHVEAGSNIRPDLARVACGWTVGICPITWDGRMVACGTDCDAQHPFGNVSEQSISEIWNGNKKAFTQKHLEHKFDLLPAMCQTCMDWQVIGSVDFDEAGQRYYKEYK